ncbi:MULTISPECIES: DUF4407 domain-containing protein [Sphingobacterium]|jgi:hypothetical protein|nr:MULTISPECIES: DUF4407 domain-containing protein [Sphingobacterium]
MRNWWIKFGCFLTGWNYNILQSCTEASYKQLKKYTSAILILIILWAFVGYSFADRYIQTGTWGSIGIAIIFVLIIIQIERQIILNVGHNKFASIFRMVIAVIMAVLGSAILDQIIFKDDIEKKMIEIVDRQVKKQLPDRLSVINTKLSELQVEIDSLDHRNIELYKQISQTPTINTVSTSVTTVPIKNEDGSITNKTQRTVSNNPIANPKIKEADLNNNNLKQLRDQYEEYSQRKLKAEESLRAELKTKKGFLEELNAMLEILKESTVALIFYVILLAFLISLELFVLLSKSDKNKSDYDLIMEHQLDQKRKTLDGLK